VVVVAPFKTNGRVFEPHWSADQRDTTFRSWQKAITAARERIF